jgi:acyl-coenzyme A thioesterase 13
VPTMRCSSEPCYSETVAEFSAPQDLAVAALTGDRAALAAYLEALKQRSAARRDHFGAHLGVEIIEILSDRVTMRLPWRPELRRGGGIFHGGVIMGLADHVAGSVFNTDPRIAASGSTGLTTDFNVSFLSSAEPGEALIATGWVLKRGKRVSFLQVDIHAETSAKVVAICRATYLTVPRKSVLARRPTGTGG